MVRAKVKPNAELERWARRLENPRDALNQIGAMLVATSQRAFRDQRLGDVDWLPRGEVNVLGILADMAAGKREVPLRRFETRPVLRDTGRLAASIAHRVVGSDTVEVGSALDYAAAHQWGGEVESVTIDKKVQQNLARWLKKQPNDIWQKLARYTNRKWLNRKIKTEVPARPFLGVTDEVLQDIKDTIGVTIFEVS